MKKLFVPILLAVTVLVCPKTALASSEKVNVYLFYSNTCPHCRDEMLFLSSLEEKYTYLKVNMYEVTTSRRNAALFSETAQKLGTNSAAVPFLVVGENYIVGFRDADTTGKEIINEIEKTHNSPSRDVVAETLGKKDENQNEGGSDKIKETLENRQNTGHTDIKIPFFGTVNTRNLSLPVLTFTVALLDGFNPCAMWVLLFLISMLLGSGNRKRMFLLGSAFIFTSGFVYFLFLAAWLNFFLFLGFSTVVRTIIGFVAASMGIYYLYDYWYLKKTGCHIMESKKRQKVFEDIRRVVQKKNLALAITGIMLLAFAVNLVELMCSAGLPAVYTNILSMSNLTPFVYYIYLTFYILVFMIDDIIVFAITVITLKATGIQGKYQHYSHLIGGLLMILIGLALLFKPQILMF